MRSRAAGLLWPTILARAGFEDAVAYRVADLTLSDRVADLVEEGYDAAIRIGALPDPSLIARPLAPYEFTACASPAYLARRGTPRSNGREHLDIC